jgi:hypothetical protein
MCSSQHARPRGTIDGIADDRVQAAIASLLASSRLVALGRRYVIHPDALKRVERQLRPSTTTRIVAAMLGASRTQAHAVLSYYTCSKLTDCRSQPGATYGRARWPCAYPQVVRKPTQLSTHDDWY